MDKHFEFSFFLFKKQDDFFFLFGILFIMKVSVLIPTLGRDSLHDVLRALFLSVDFEIYNPEILIIFDGEMPLGFLSHFEFRDSVVLLETKHKVFASGTRNLGLDHATGDIVAFLGDDTIPDPLWLSCVVHFHLHHPQKEIAFLGKVSWTPALSSDPFHRWLENNLQFDFRSLQKKTPSWRHFYTSNVSLKRAFIGKERFHLAFSGWGFEDGEFGYRLFQKGLRLIYDSQCQVFHDHPQSFTQILCQVKSARENALIFESLHPEISLLPRGKKLFLLRVCVFLSWPLSFFLPSFRWWRAWKKTWIGEK